MPHPKVNRGSPRCQLRPIASNWTSQESLRTMQRVGARAGKSSQDLPFAASGALPSAGKAFLSVIPFSKDDRRPSRQAHGAFVCQPCLGSPWEFSDPARSADCALGLPGVVVPQRAGSSRVFFRGRVFRVIRGRLRSRAGCAASGWLVDVAETVPGDLLRGVQTVDLAVVEGRFSPADDAGLSGAHWNRSASGWNLPRIAVVDVRGRRPFPSAESASVVGRNPLGPRGGSPTRRRISPPNSSPFGEFRSWRAGIAAATAGPFRTRFPTVMICRRSSAGSSATILCGTGSPDRLPRDCPASRISRGMFPRESALWPCPN